MESLGVDLKLLVAQAINFALFFYIFKKFIAKPFIGFINDESKREKEKEAALVVLKKKEEEMDKAQSKMKSTLKTELDKAILKSKENASAYKTKLIAEAKKEAEEVILKARKQIEAEKTAMEKEMKNKLVGLSTMMVEKAFENYLSTDAQKEINKNILKNSDRLLN